MSEPSLELNVEELKRVYLVSAAGRIDSSNALEFDQYLKNNTVDLGKYNIVLDLSGVEFMSSAGLRAIVALLRESKKHRGDVRLAAPSERVMDVLSLAGLDALFSIYDNPTAAVGSF